MPARFNKIDFFKSEFNRLIVDDNIKEFILGGQDFKRRLKSSADYLLYMNNCLTLAYLYIYSCYQQLHEESEDEDGEFKDYIPNQDNNSLRLLNSLKKTYIQYPLTQELIQYVILDVQFDMQQGAEQSKLNRLFHNLCNFTHLTMSGETFNLVKYFNYIAKWRLAPTRFDELTNDQVIDLFLDLITNMTFLHGHLCRVDDDYAFVDSGYYNRVNAYGGLDGDELDESVLGDYSSVPFKDCIPTRHTIIKGDDCKTFGFFYLCNLEPKVNIDVLDLTYTNTIGFGNRFIRVSNKPQEHLPEGFEALDYRAPNYYYEITNIPWDESPKGDMRKKKQKNIIDQIHAINYKYIKNLALAVSDAVSRDADAPNTLYTAFSEKHPNLFINWDTDANELDSVIIMLMIEESPTSVLECLFTNNKQLFFDIVTNIDRRFDDKTLLFHKKSKAELEKQVKILIEERLLMGERNSFKVAPSREKQEKNMNKLRPKAQALLIISSLLRLVEEDRQNEYIYAGNIYANIDTINGLKNSSDTAVKIEFVRNILIDTFKHLICFYEGVYAYGDKKAGYDLESMNVCLPRSRIDATQKLLVDEFMAAARARADRFKESDRYTDGNVRAYIDDFIEVCNKCYKSSNSSERSYREKLYSAIGKYEIIDLDVFYNCIQSGLGDSATVEEDNVDRWIDFAIVVMEYFKTGSFRDTSIDHNLMDAVYPFAAAYSKRNENRDGQITVTFTISIDIDNNGEDDYRQEINVLTEFSYNLQEIFYCLPNVQRSNSRWWIDPLLISFTGFNSIFD